jgi:hypothetical protein
VEFSAEVLASSVPFDETMLIAVVPLAHGELLIGPVTLLMVAEASVKVTEPKFASGNTPLFEDGASTIHSADERWKLLPLWLTLNELLPVGSERSLMLRVNLPVVVL